MENWQHISGKKYSPTCSGKKTENSGDPSGLHGRIMERLDLSRQMSEEEIKEMIDVEILRDEKARYLDLETKTALRREIFYASGGWESFRI